MPRNYERKTSRASYSHQDLQTAIEKVKNNEMSNYAASKMYGIPTSTLNDRVRNKSGMISQTLGRPPAIPLEYEMELASCLRTLEKWGWGLSREEVLEITSEFIKKNNLKTPFVDGKPGPDWFISFRKRHNLSIKKPQPVEYLRKRMTDPFVVYDYFKKLEEVITELNLESSPDRIWNLDETSVCLDPTKTKVVGAVGKPCTRTTVGSAKENVTVLTTVNAAGKKMTPLIVYKGKNTYEEWMAEENPEYDFEIAYVASKRGWMEADIFLNYMSDILIPSLGPERPVLIIYDGHITHVDNRVVSLAKDNNVTIMKLPAHTSHLLQPLDIAVFKSLKAIWDKKLVKFQRQNVGVRLRKKAFAELFAETWHQTSSKVIQNGFKKGGIYPFNAGVVPQGKFDPSALKRWKISEKKKEIKPLKQLCLEAINNTIQSADNCDAKHPEPSVPKNTFEELLLEKLKYHPQTVGKVARKRVANAAEVITRKILENKKKEQHKTPKETLQKPKTKSSKIQQTSKSKPNCTEVQDEGDSTDSKIIDDSRSTGQNKRKFKTEKESRKKLKTCSSITSNSIGKQINVQCGSDVFNDFEEFDMVNWIDDNDARDLDGFVQKSIKKTERDLNKDLQFDLIQTESEMEEDLQKQKNKNVWNLDTEHNQEDEQSAMIDILDDQTGFLRKVTVTQAIIEKPKPSKDSVSCEDLEESKENVFNIINHQQEIQSYTKKYVMKQRNTKPNKKKILRSSSSTTDEDIMSVHSDSDICDIISVEDEEDKDENVVPTKYEKDKDLFKKNIDEKEAAIFAQIYEIDNIEKQALIDNEKSKTRNKNKIQKRERKIVTRQTKKQKKIENNESEGKTVVSKNKENEACTYNLGTNILAKYFYKKNWKHYVGSITEIINEDEFEKTYRISFYKTVQRKNTLKFIQPKRSDEDCIPANQIVKEINLIQIKENPNEFVLDDDNDDVYFT